MIRLSHSFSVTIKSTLVEQINSETHFTALSEALQQQKDLT